VGGTSTREDGEGSAVAEHVGVLDGDVHRRGAPWPAARMSMEQVMLRVAPTAAIWWRNPTVAEKRLTMNIPWSPRMSALYGWMGIL
jgi:hypothetical protein